VGDDPFGHFLAQTLTEVGVDTAALCFSSEARTALAFVSLRADGERELAFTAIPAPTCCTGRTSRHRVYPHGQGPALWLDQPDRRAIPQRDPVGGRDGAEAAGCWRRTIPTCASACGPAPRPPRGDDAGWPLAHVIKVSAESWLF